MRILCSHALSFWKMKPEPTAAIPKGITTGYNENMQMRWPSTAIDLISVIFAHPNLFKLICGFDMNMIRNNFYSPILKTLLDISF